MPKSSKQKLAYMAQYQDTPEMIERREARNRARYQALKKGAVKKGDGKDVAHVVALDNGGPTTPANLKVESASKNRGWRAGRKGYSVPKDGGKAS